MSQALIIYHSCAALFSGIVVYFLYKIKSPRSLERFLLLGVFQLGILTLGAILYPLSGFGRLQLWAWGVFLYVPIFLAGSIVIFRGWKPSVSITAGVLLFGLLVTAADAFLIEPYWVKLTHLTLESDKLEETLSVAILADIQTDSPGIYEQNALELVAAHDPDLVLYAGDYLQVPNQASYHQAAQQLNEILQTVQLHPRLGSFAVRGNVDWNIWEEIFRDLDVTLFNTTAQLDLGPLQLTGLAWLESGDPDLQVTGMEKFHIVLGHSPNYSLGEIEADLLLAGHTHGGQIRLPFLGPILTLSAVPRSWAAGLTEINPDQYLLVSRGIGLERGDAPRMRFLCRPEIIILTLQPVR